VIWLAIRGSLRTKFDQQPIQQLVVQIQCVRDLVGLAENRLGFIRGFVLQVRGERIVVQVEVPVALDDPNQNGRRGWAE